jgi:hypothetical protein
MVAAEQATGEVDRAVAGHRKALVVGGEPLLPGVRRHCAVGPPLFSASFAGHVPRVAQCDDDTLMGRERFAAPDLPRAQRFPFSNSPVAARFCRQSRGFKVKTRPRIRRGRR